MCRNKVTSTPFTRDTIMRYFVSFTLMAFPFIVMAGEQLKHGPDSEYHDGVPKGKVEQQPKWKSQIFPGTERDWWIYVPAQYDAAKYANVMVFQDGGGPVSDKSDMRSEEHTSELQSRGL